MKKISSNLKKDFFWNTLGTAFNSFNSLFFLIAVTRINGINDAGIFTFSFSLVCLFYVIGSYSGRTYQVTDNSDNITSTDYFYSKIITCAVMVIVALAFSFIKGYDMYKTMIIIGLIVYRVFEALSETLYAIMQQNNLLYKSGISMFLKSALGLTFFILVDYLTNNLIFSIIAYSIISIIIMLFYDKKVLFNIKFKLDKFNFENVKQILIGGFFTFCFSFLTLFIINAQKYAIDGVLSNSNQTIFGIIIMPATLLSLFGQLIIQPFLVKLKADLHSNPLNFARLVYRIIACLVVLGLLVVVVSYFIGIPLLELLYGVNLKSYLPHLLIILVGAIFYVIANIFSIALTTMRKTGSQLVIYAAITVVTFVFSKVLIQNYGLIGASSAYTGSMILLMLLIIALFTFEILKIIRGGNRG